MTPLLVLDGVSVRLAGRDILSDVSLDVRAGEVIGLVGPNGAGKSTALRAALGLVPATGRVALGDDALPNISPERRARRAAYLPQERELAWDLSVEAVVALGRRPWAAPGREAAEADARAVDAALARMALGEHRRRPAGRLSGGERARVLIARALAQETPLLLADEPTAGLDPAHALSLAETFRAIAAEGRGVVATLHDLTLAARACDRLIVLHRGGVAASGPPRDVLTPALLARVYGVEATVRAEPEGLLAVPIRRI